VLPAPDGATADKLVHPSEGPERVEAVAGMSRRLSRVNFVGLVGLGFHPGPLFLAPMLTLQREITRLETCLAESINERRCGQFRNVGQRAESAGGEWRQGDAARR